VGWRERICLNRYSEGTLLEKDIEVTPWSADDIHQKNPVRGTGDRIEIVVRLDPDTPNRKLYLSVTLMSLVTGASTEKNPG
jgi:hypothetical protein